MPFTPDQFLDVFAAYNAAWRPAIATLWVLTVCAAIAWRWLPYRPPFDTKAMSRAVALLLAVNWAWAGIVYHWEFFAAINPIAAAFAVLFVAQAALFVWLGVARRRLTFDRRFGPWGSIATALVVYGICYPALAIASGHPYPRVPTFGVPCPTTLVTVGWLCATDDLPVALTVIPLAWCIVGGSAAFLLGMPVDLALPVAGLALVARLIDQGAHHGRFEHAFRLVHRHR